MIIKFGENLSNVNLESAESCIPLLNEDILSDFRKTANGVKKVAPAADDFLFFSAVMMHAAEASAINEDGSPKILKSGEPVKVGWRVDANGSWKWETNDPNIKPYKNCFVPGTKVLMSNGSVKNIEDIKAGDEVITHLGNVKKVVRTFTTPHTGKLLKIQFSNGVDICTTHNHEFFGGKDTNSRKIKNKKQTLAFYKAEELVKNDYVASPKLNIKNDSIVSYDLARLLGLFAAEGSYTKKDKKRSGIIFSYSKDEQDLINETSNLLIKLFNKKPTINYTSNKCDLRVSSMKIAETFYNHVGEYSKEKTISEKIVFNKDNEVKRQFILGWLEGDGSVDKLSGKVVGTTVSENMASQITLMLNSLNIQNSLFKYSESKSEIDNRLIDGGPGFRVKIPYNVAKTNFADLSKLNKFTKVVKEKVRSDFNNSYRFYKVLNKKEIDYSGNVYNFEVEGDNSYCVGNVGYAVHNCNHDIFPEQELITAHKKWINKPLCIDHKSSSVDHVRGFIVDTYYDRKLKRVVALCALDKKNYPELAHKVSAKITPSVSMGTAVTTAICTDCGRVAKVEADFCNHMKTKSAYGEINIGLNPIELSIVVNPADPRAKIKHIIAAAENLNNYVRSKEAQLKKVAEPSFYASLSFSDYDNENKNGSNTSFNISTNSLESFLKDLNKVIEKLKDRQSQDSEDDDSDDKSEKDSNDSEDKDSNKSESVLAMGLPASKKLASKENFDEVLESIASKIDSMQRVFNKLLDEENMSVKQAYYQGTEEPTPGEVKYDIDPKNKDLREKGDKQMHVDDMGGPDGMHPGVKSVNMSELERKKMLARAAAEERALKRAAIVEMAKDALNKTADTYGSQFEKAKADAIFELHDHAQMLTELIQKQTSPQQMKEALDDPKVKPTVQNLTNKYPKLKKLCEVVGCNVGLGKSAYFQGGGGVNEPTPGKTKYKPEALNEDLRDEDKHMVGKKPFPDVGSPDKLYGDDLKKKEMLSRAGLTAKFVKASSRDGAVDLNKTGWEVYSGSNLVLKASVNALSGGRGDLFYDSIATEDFGKKLISQVKVAGASGVAKMYKIAQDPNAVPPAPPPAPPGDAMAMPPADAPPADAPPMGEDLSNPADTEDPKQKASKLADEALNIVSDLKEAVKALTEEQQNMQAPAAEGGAELPKTASFDDRALQAMRLSLNPELKTALKSCIAELNDNIAELDQVNELCSRRVVTASNKELAFGIFESAFDATKESIANAYSLMDAFVKYAKGVDALVKRAQASELEELSDDGEMYDDLQGLSDPKHKDDGYDDDLHGLSDLLDEDVDAEPVESDSEDMMDLGEKDDLDVEGLGDLETDSEDLEDLEGSEDLSDEDLEDLSLDENDANLKTNKDGLSKLQANPGDTVQVVASLKSKEGRMALRAKLAADTMKISPLLHDAHPKGSYTPKFEEGASDKLDQFEDLEDQHDMMMKAVNAPVKVRKEAAMIHKLISEGSLSVEDLDDLVSRGADKETIAYYKKYYGEVDGGSEFASELVKDHAKAEVQKTLEVEKVKLARAYDLAYEMADKGLCSSDRKSIASKVDEIMKFNDASFESLKNIVASSKPLNKVASRLPNVGSTEMFGDRQSPVSDDLFAQISAALSSSKRRMF